VHVKAPAGCSTASIVVHIMLAPRSGYSTRNMPARVDGVETSYFRRFVLVFGANASCSWELGAGS